MIFRECLTVIDQSKFDTHKIFVTTDAILSFSCTLSQVQPNERMTVRPIAFDSCTFKDAELNYPVHKKELLAIMCALKNGSVISWAILSSYIQITKLY